jgi:hypothetical protein
VTNCYKQSELPTTDDAEDEEDEDEEHEEIPYDMFLDYCGNDDTNDNDPTLFSGKLQDFSFKPIRNLGLNRCGFHEYVPEADLNSYPSTSTQDDWVYSDSSRPLKCKVRLPDGRAPSWKVSDILKVLLRKSFLSR